MSDRCPHKRLRSTALILRDSNGSPEGISISVVCASCGNPFEFVGVQSSATVLVAEDRREVRMLIAAHKEKGAQAEA